MFVPGVINFPNFCSSLQVCDVCFTQSQEHGALEVNELDPTLMSFRSRAGVKRARAKTDAPEVAPLAAFQEILRMQVETLITKFGVRVLFNCMHCRV